MANNVQAQSTTSEIISLSRETVRDMKDLFTQEAAAARAEVRAEWHQVNTAFVIAERLQTIEERAHDVIDPRYQVRQRPWQAVGAAMITSYLVGNFVYRYALPLCAIGAGASYYLLTRNKDQQWN